MAALDRTEIVNLMLAAAGESEVSAGEVTTPTLTEVKLAVRILDKVDREVQQEAWSFNRVLNLELTPVANEIALAAATYISIEAVDRTRPLAIVNSKLFDRWENSYTFTGPVRVNAILRRAFTELPQHALNLIMARATYQFVERYLGEGQPSLEGDAIRAQQLFHNTELELADYRLSDAPDTGRAFMRQPPLSLPHA